VPLDSLHQGFILRCSAQDQNIEALYTRAFESNIARFHRYCKHFSMGGHNIVPLSVSTLKHPSSSNSPTSQTKTPYLLRHAKRWVVYLSNRTWVSVPFFSSISSEVLEESKQSWTGSKTKSTQPLAVARPARRTKISSTKVYNTLS
jgi:hypothetical protein